jgi:putative GTP pyrophosphokinase
MMASKAEINRLGDTLRDAALNNEVLNVEALVNYRHSFWDAEDQVARKLGLRVGLGFTSRTKSTESIVAKLIRQPKIRLSQIQDIVGFRYVVSDLREQDNLCNFIQLVFPEAKIKDRRTEPQYGYRAIHLTVVEEGKKIEIQVRTRLQHLWAQYSEMLADRAGHELKYGGGHEKVRHFLEDISKKIHARDHELIHQGISLNAQQVHDEFKAMLPVADTPVNY